MSSVNHVNSSWLNELDYWRGIAFLGVALQHVLGIYAHNGEIAATLPWSVTVGLAFNLVKFAVPAFVLVSGLVLVNKYKPDIQVYSFYRKRVRELLIPYFLWTAIYQLYYNAGAGQLALNPKVWALQAITGNGAYHLWYVVLLIQFYILFPLVLPFFRWLNQQKRLWLILAIAALIYISLMWFSCYFLPAHPLWTANHWLQLLAKYRDRNVVFWFFYFLAGGVIALRIQTFYQWLAQIRIYNFFVWFILLLWVTWELTAGIKNNVVNLGYSTTLKPSMFLFTMSSLLLLYNLCLALKDHTSRLSILFQTYGRYSQGAYFIHPLMLAVAMYVIRHSGLLVSYPLMSLALAFFICVFLALLITYLLSLIPGGKWLTGTITHQRKQ